jgi:hypothetical protein
VAAGFQAHLLEQFLRAALVLGARHDARAHLLKPTCEPVAQPLQLLQVQQARANAARTWAAGSGGQHALARERVRGSGNVGETVGHDRRELAL